LFFIVADAIIIVFRYANVRLFFEPPKKNEIFLLKNDNFLFLAHFTCGFLIRMHWISSSKHPLS